VIEVCGPSQSLLVNRRNVIQDLLLILHEPAISLFEPEIDLNSEGRERMASAAVRIRDLVGHYLIVSLVFPPQAALQSFIIVSSAGPDLPLGD
jgi:hypothetical protein